MTEIPPLSVEAKPARTAFQKMRKDAMIHVIIAVALAVFVIAGYFPSPEGPKYDPIERKEIPAAASAETRVAIDKENVEIDKKNAEGREKLVRKQREWEKDGRANHLAMRMMAQFCAALLAALWVVFFVCSYLVRPLLKFLKDFLGDDFARVITPMVVLGISYVLAQIVLQNTSVKELGGHGFTVTVIAYLNHVLRPFLGFIVNFTEFVVKNWTVGLVYLAIVIYAIIRKFKTPVQ